MTETEIPTSLQERILFLDGKIIISAEVENDATLMSFLSYAARKGFTETERKKAEEFQKLRKEHFTKAETSSDIQELAVQIIADAYEQGASDIHITDHGPFTSISFRKLGMVQDYKQLMGETGRKIIVAIYQTMSNQGDSTFVATESQDARISDRKFLPSDVHSIRVHTEPLEEAMAENGTGTEMALRLLYDRTTAQGSLEERLATLGYSERHMRRIQFLTQRSGLVLLSGPTGAGKSTFLKHIMESMAKDNPEKNFFSAEDPVEYPLERVKQIRIRTSSKETRGEEYSGAIAGLMRCDPDIIMIGEIRYPEAASAALDAAQTGHGVWTTVHANSAFGIIQRMVSLLRAANYPDPLEYLCDHTVLSGLHHQRLVPVLCPHCKQPIKEISKLPADNELRRKHLPEPVLSRLFKAVDKLHEKNVHVRGEGCEHCRGIGIIGQTVASEIVATDHVILRNIRAGNMAGAYKHWRNEQNGETFVSHAIRLIEEGIIDPYLTEKRLGVPLNYAKVSDDFSKGISATGFDEMAGSKIVERPNAAS
ncbi:GspE/PulE family protein [Desulfovibrio sp. JC010]|uniref:GspE/PulE family protein n=1 Tax=Desulfovibrio sp. JC010 TaxID=2593641 RepID=UPI0013D33FFE|nr:ATPase, T2SS/T4P/T4SS family [Desulfovibrio sp. JC010]NDV26916.1 secretion system protein E [Desulfovibrio sp. JC010]